MIKKINNNDLHDARFTDLTYEYECALMYEEGLWNLSLHNHNYILPGYFLPFPMYSPTSPSQGNSG